MARAISRHYRIKPPSVIHRREGKRGWTAGTYDKYMSVNVDRAGWTPMLLCHEMAHWVVAELDYAVPNHGPLWMGIYLYLLGKYRVLPIHASVYSARKFGIKFRSPLECGPEDL